MPAAVLETPGASASVDTERLRDIVLVRIASAVRGVSRTDLANDLVSLVAHRLSVGRWRSLLDGAIDSLTSTGQVQQRAGRIEASDAGIERASHFLGLKGHLPRLWNELRDQRLVAVALALQREPAKRIKGLADQEGLRAAIVQRAYGLKIKGVATASRLRTALAAVALQRAFGNQIKAGLTGKTGFSASAGRLLAAQLSRQPRDFGTDARLIAALAAEHVGATKTDVASLRLGVLRAFVGGDDAKPASKRPAAVATAKPRLVEPAPAPVPASPATARPDLAGFVQEVRRQAAGQAQGWPGNRRAYISHVWRHIRDQRPDWGVSEIEFKCMLAEAHRAGHVVLANADLKDSKNIKDLQDSAVVFKNAVFHFIRVDA
ncbi:MAG TPA: hypothetical protein VFR73_03095 [Hyphomicrobiaceae bacterium]|nr:hypothetical protein [Hyphomicrobiaceae bacterium]